MLLSTAAMLAAFPASAATPVNYDSSWVAISSAADLKSKFKTSGKYYLTADITIDSSWTALTGNSFTIDGRDTSGKVHNINFTSNKSLLGGCHYATVQNVNLTGSMTYTEIWRSSPLTDNYLKDPTLKNITSSVNFTFTGAATGNEPPAGLASWVSDTGSTLIENCVYEGTIRCDNYVKGVGGLIGVYKPETKNGNGTAVIRNCVNRGTISLGSGYLTDTRGISIGGIIANMWSDQSNSADILIEGCSNESRTVNGTKQPFLKFDDCVPYIGTNHVFGGIIGRINPKETKVTLKNCTNKADISLNYGFVMGGIVGYIERNTDSNREVIFDGCKNYGNFTFAKRLIMAGGILGYSYSMSKLTLKNCENNGAITVKANSTVGGHEGIGGIVGKLFHWRGEDYSSGASPRDNTVAGYTPSRAVVIENCVNNGAITLETGIRNIDDTSLNYHIGGIVGRAYGIESLKIHKCKNNASIATVFSSKDDNARSRWESNGGIIGTFITTQSTSRLEIRDCHNKGNVSGKYAGGILGATYQIRMDLPTQIDIQYCSNSGTITGMNYGSWGNGVKYNNTYVGDAGGIIGGMDQGGDPGGVLTVKYCLNEGNVRGGRFAGGILAVRTPQGSTNPQNSYIDNCVNKGKIESAGESNYYAAAGIVGSAKGTMAITNCANTGELVSSYTKIPIANLQEDQWSSTFSNNVQYADGSSTFAAYDLFAKGDRTTSGDNGIAATNTTNATSKVTSVMSSVFKGSEGASGGQPYAGQTITVYDVRDFAKYDLGARIFVLGANISSNENAIYYDFPDTLEGINFDGKGYTVDLYNKRFFKTVKDSTLKNVKITGAVTYGANGGALASVAGGTTVIENVTSSLNISKWNEEQTHMGIGGVVGQLGIDGITNNITIKNCTYSGTLDQNYGNDSRHKCSGGIAGHVLVGSANDVITIESCTNNGSIKGTRVAGIVGGICTNNRQSDKGDGAFKNAKVNITKCTNNGVVDAYAMAAGIVADTTDRSYLKSEKTNGAGNDALQTPYANVVVDECLNTAKITASGEPAGYGANGYQAWSGGIAALADGNVVIKNSINTGFIDSRTGDTKNSNRATGGIVGGKMHQSYAATDNNTGLRVENCKNTGDVFSNAHSIGGIVGYAWVGNLTIKSCVNTGHVCSYSTAQANTAYTAGGILGTAKTWSDTNSGYFYEGGSIQKNWKDSEYKINVENCINAGLVEIKVAPLRDADAWKNAAGIVGATYTGIKITGCLHTGRLEDNAPWFNSTFPIANALEGVWGFQDKRPIEQLGIASGWNDASKLPANWFQVKQPVEVCEWGGNYYTAGSVDDVLMTSTVSYASYVETGHANLHIIDHYGQPLYKMSQLATDEEIKMTIQAADVYAFDRVSYLDDQVEFAEWIYFDDEDPSTNQPGHVEDEGSVKYKGLNFTAEELANLATQISKGNTLMAKTDANDLWGRQNTVYAQEQAIREAINASHANGTYTIVIPATIPTNAEVKIDVGITGFSYYEGVKVSLTSQNDFKLKMNKDGVTHSIEYSPWYEGGENYLMFSNPLMTLDQLMLIEGNKDLVYSEDMTRSMIAKVDSAANADKPEGIYKDRVTFKAEKINIEKQKVEEATTASN